ncbi:MAG: 50S ribosomal protein L11 methyltransferase [Corallococcus sp.]|nr:50S ribosomal protein L11 methyltransferase [Corallococcus sp.]MCM1360085.1 50S ribosomal protein L11 methyltransferase [Corallococcus sp.]MCM1395642.1 50S ribosomal protein L11 methyltransferase [Corallococcus sp.]
MKYSEITVFTNSQSAELVAYFLQEVCMDGVSIYDPKDLYQNPSWDYKDAAADSAYCSEVKVKGYCNLEDTEGVLAFLSGSFSTLVDAGSLRTEVNEVEGDAWVQTWQQTFRPIETEKLVLCPEWQTPVYADGKEVLLLNTGVAFGTGQHETTSMCLQLLEGLRLAGARVLDVGCGSGILGLSALKLGADFAELVDIDEQATAVALHNAQINSLQNRCAIKTGNLTEQTDGTFDFVFANLTADILALLYDDLSKVVDTGSVIVMSGILDTKLSDVEKLYSQKFTICKTLKKGEWRALLLKA